MEKKKIYTVFPEGRYKALTLSYDDGTVDDLRLISILRKYGLKATFNLNSGLCSTDANRIDSSRWKEVYDGFEVASHTVSHPTLTRCPSSRVVEEILEDRRYIEDTIGYLVRGFAYPNGSYSDEIIRLLPSLGISYARIVGNSDSFELPENYYQWKATCHHNHRLIENAKAFIDFKKPWYLKLMYVWGHSFEFSQDDNWSLIEEFAKMVGSRDDIWYATNIEIIDYMEAAKRLIFTADCSKAYNPSALDVWLMIDDHPTKIKKGDFISL